MRSFLISFPILLLTFFLLTSSSFAKDSATPQAQAIIFKDKIYQQDLSFSDEEKKLFADLNGDGKNELIWTFRASPVVEGGFPRAFTLIYKINGNDKKLSKTIRGNERPDHIDFLDLNGDGKKEMAIFTTGGNHYTSLAIYQYRNNDHVPIFEEGSASGIAIDKDSKPPVIKIGRGDWGRKGGWDYASDPVWEVYQWNGKQFEYSKKLSTTDWIGEKQDIQNSINNALKKFPLHQDGILVFKKWIAGARVEDLFPNETLSSHEAIRDVNEPKEQVEAQGDTLKELKEVVEFARTHKDYAQLRPAMYELSLDPKNTSLTLQELYDLAKAGNAGKTPLEKK